MSEYPTGTGRPASPQEGTLQQGKDAAREVAGTAVERTAQVADEAKNQTRRAVNELRNRVREQSEHQSQRAAQSLRQWSEDLSSLQDHAKPDSPVTGVVRQIAGQGHRAADYLDRNGLAGVVDDVQSFARRRPGAFLAGALAAGFLVGRIMKTANESTETETGQGERSPLSSTGTVPSAPAPVVQPEPAGPAPVGDAFSRQDTRPVVPPAYEEPGPAVPGPEQPRQVPPRSTPPTYGAGSDLP
ncbi:hypothetical protein Nocox_32825 [Nonomuraea coxensis DSM 45129]|uniref:DUF3618 domain-containing protein n=1 Tax=Nonomuraea coxensis DSM 45129 TaxID=1122611 RepID=A0ABX8U8L2_9ACTN|nr:hypothetical protein [Nonomuraea coxensis]QYC44136.1 hypothetical protein Nocox_32825 [Nonomuraea coxensis DSM 45129]